MSAFADRILGPFRTLIRGATARVDYYALYSAIVNTDNGDETCDLTPEDARLPSMQAIPKMYGVPGLKTNIQPGTKVLVCFQNGDPSKPAIVLFGTGGSLETDLTATLLKLNGGSLPVARQTDSIAGTAGPYPIASGLITGGNATVEG